MYIVSVNDRLLLQLPHHIRSYIMDLIKDIQGGINYIEELIERSPSMYKDEYREKLDEIKEKFKNIVNDPTCYWHPDLLIDELQWINDELRIIEDLLREDEETE